MKAEMTRWRLERRHKKNERPMFHFLAYPYCSHRPEQLCLWCHEGRPPKDQEKAKEAAVEAWQRHLQEVKRWEIRQLKKEEEEDKQKKDEGSKKRRILTQEGYEAEEKAKEKKEKEETERLNIAKWMMMSDEELINRLD